MKKKEMLINVLQPEETRIAILEDDVLEELSVAREAHESLVGNIYKGRVVNIESSIQAVFVDFGVGRNGFLHISDVDPRYYESGKETIELVPSEEEPPREAASADRADRRGPGRPGGGERGRRDDRGRRPSRGRSHGRGERRPPAPAEPAAIPQGPLPELEDLTIDDDVDFFEEKLEEQLEEKPQEADFISPPPEPVEEFQWTEPSEPGPTAQEEPAGDEFGSGILDDDPAPEGRPRSGGAPNPADWDDPPIERQRGVPRRTDPPGRQEPEEEGEFGSGLFDDEPAPPPLPRPVEPPPVFEPREKFEPPAQLEPPAPLESVSQEESVAPPVSAPVSMDRPAREETEEGGEPRSRRRRRRGGRRRRGRGGEEGEAPARPDRPAPEPDRPAPEPASAAEEDFAEAAAAAHDEELEPPTRESPRPQPRGRAAGRDGRRSAPRRPREYPPIQTVFRRGQEVLVQVIKEGIGNKGPTLSTYISIPGRYLVLMPGLGRVGVSRKIIDEDERRRLRDIVVTLDRPKGVGLIVRTAGVDRTREEIERDLAYLARLWESMVRRIKQTKSPAVIYQESDLIIRAIRDIFDEEVDTIWIDEKNAYERAREFLLSVMPSYEGRLKFYDSPEPLFHHFGIEDEIAKIQQRQVPLPQGGSIVIDQTEALVAIDVNSGRFRSDGNAEETAYQINMAAAREIARQLRLRDLGGVIINDFIDMREERHRRSVENSLRDAVRRDRARTKVLRISPFGIIEMTRQRIRPSLKRSFYRECPMCRGTGQVKNAESMGIDSLRLLTYVAQQEEVRRIDFSVDPEIAEYLHNQKRRELAAIEQNCDVVLTIRGVKLPSVEDYELCCYDARGSVVDVDLNM